MNKRPEDTTGLRSCAGATLDALAAELSVPLESLSPEVVQQMLHELRVHQIELEMQNEELRIAKAELEASRARYADLYDLAPVGYCCVGETGLILQANLTLAAFLGKSRGVLLKQAFSRIISMDDQDTYYLFRERLLATGELQFCELRLHRSDGSLFWAHLVGTTARDADARVLRIVLSEISERKQAEALLHKSEAFSLAVLDALNAEIAVLDREGTIVAINRAWRRFAPDNGAESGPAAPINVGGNYLKVCQVEGARDAHDGIRAVLEGRLPEFSLEYACHSPEQQRWFNMSVTPLGDGAVVAHSNITEHKKAENALREQEAFFHLIAENLGDYIAVLDPQGRRLYNSPSYLQFFGEEADLLGTDSFANIHPDDKERVKQVFRETVQTGIGRHIIYRFVTADGRIREMESSGNVITDSEGRVSRVVVVAQDVTERRQLEEDVRQLAFHDALTQLPNRRLLNDRVSQAMAASARSGCYGALMFLDLDNFKLLNDTYGHVVGDLLLIEVAARLKACVRGVDTVARFGGDEFVVMISELDTDRAASIAQAQIVAEKILTTLSEPYRLAVEGAGQSEIIVEHRCTVSVGVVLFVSYEESQIDILKWADRAMYRAKKAGGDLIWFHE